MSRESLFTWLGRTRSALDFFFPRQLFPHTRFFPHFRVRKSRVPNSSFAQVPFRLPVPPPLSPSAPKEIMSA